MTITREGERIVSNPPANVETCCGGNDATTNGGARPTRMPEIAASVVVETAVKLLESATLIEGSQEWYRARRRAGLTPFVAKPVSEILPAGMVTGEPPLPVTFSTPIRNMLYHVWPHRNGLWRPSIMSILRRAELFNGKWIVGIVTDGNCENYNEVIKAFDGRIDKVILKENKGLREIHTLEDMLAEVASDNEQEVTFYSHSKGMTHQVEHTSHLWSDVMRETLLDYWPVVASVLETKAIAGSFKKIGHGFAESASDWHYSGSFFWFRNRDLFRRDWRMHDQIWFGVETWPSLMFRIHESGTVFYDGRVGEMNLYESEYWRTNVTPFLNSWKERNAAFRTK